MSVTDRRSAHAALACLAALALAPTSRAQSATPSAADAAAAETLFVEAKRLLDAGDVARACATFAESQKLDPGAGTLLNLADCYERNGQLASAWVTFREAAAAAERGARPAWVAQAKERARMIEPNVPTLTVRADARGTPGLIVTRNGAPLDPLLFGTAIPLDPGPEAIEARAPGKAPWSTTVTIDAQHAKVDVQVPPLDDAEPPNAAPADAPRSAPAGPSAARVASYALLGGGVVGAAIGAVLGATAIHKDGEAASRCPASPRCTDPSAVSLTDEAHHAATGSTIAFVAAGALLSGGAVLFFTSESGAPRASGAVVVERGGCVVSLSGRF